MAISSVSSAAAGAPQQSNFAAIRQAFTQLTSALQSGDLTSAQSAYASLSQSGQASSGPFAQALSQIGDALQSGDVTKAKQALASLQQQFQAARGHHHHHAGGSKDAPPPSTTDASTSTSDPSAQPAAVEGTVASAATVDVTA
jgi:hypothetical protein